MFDVNLAFVLPLISSYSLYYFCLGIKYPNLRKKVNVFQIFAAIIHFVSNILLNRVIDHLHPSQEYLITFLQLFPLVCFCIYNYIQTRSLFLSVGFSLFQFIHVDTSLFAIYIYPQNDLILKVGSKFFHHQNAMLFFMKLYSTALYVSLWINNSNQHIFKFSIFVLALMSCIIFAYQQYKYNFYPQFLDIYSFKKLKKLSKLDKQGKLQKSLQNIKRINLCFEYDQVKEQEQKHLLQSLLYYFGICEIYSNFMTRLYLLDGGLYQKIDILNNTLIDKLPSSIIKGHFCTQIKEINLQFYGKYANQIALTFAKSGNFVKFHCFWDFSSYRKVQFPLLYLNLVDSYNSNFYCVLAYQKQIQQYMISNPRLVLYDLYE